MWSLVNDTPYEAERTLACDRNGLDVWLVAVKATFLVRPNGTTVLADKQEEVLQAPKHFGDPATTSLLYETDLDYTKPGTDVLLHGHAYAPQGKPCTQVDVSLKIGATNKTIRVIGNRTWKKSLLGLSMSAPEPFQKMPLRYERAFGGTDTRAEDAKHHGWERRNPVGVGFAVKNEHLIDQPLPNLEDPKALISSPRDAPAPVGFGPIARHWSPRVELAGTYDLAWEKQRQPLLPHDFNEAFFHCAPVDQRAADYLRGDEQVELVNLTPTGTLRFKLPRVALRFRTYMAGERIVHRGNLHTVVLEPDVPRVLMVWHTMLPCHGKKLKLGGSTVFEKPLLQPAGATRSTSYDMDESD